MEPLLRARVGKAIRFTAGPVFYDDWILEFVDHDHLIVTSTQEGGAIPKGTRTAVAIKHVSSLDLGPIE